jgi:hypothetical protein
MTFWKLSLYLLILAFSGTNMRQAKKYLLLAGVTTGLALLSKYTSAFLLTGVLAYLVIYDRKWFRSWELYVASLVAVIIFSPVLIWNYNNDFISFAFQSDRVGIFESGLRGDFFFTELGGQFFYNNPVNVIIAVIALISFFRSGLPVNKRTAMLLLWISLPLILLFLFFSLFRHTLPHWTGPAWTTIIFFSAAWLRKLQLMKNTSRLFNAWTTASVLLIVVVVVLGVAQVKGGLLYNHQDERPEKLGEKDVSLDMYGWRQLSAEFKNLLEREKMQGNIGSHNPFISSRWFPAANIDYYLAKPNEMEVLGMGNLDALHNYAWITEKRGGFTTGMDAWFLTVSRDFRDPFRLYGDHFNEIVAVDTVPVYRNNKHVMNAFFYYLKDLKKLPAPIIDMK